MFILLAHWNNQFSIHDLRHYTFSPLGYSHHNGRCSENYNLTGNTNRCLISSTYLWSSEYFAISSDQYFTSEIHTEIFGQVDKIFYPAVVHINNITLSNINNITLSNINNIILSNIKNITLSNINNITLSNINNITLSNINNIALSNINNIILSNINNITLLKINSITLSNISNITLSNIKKISPCQI